jgi:membrane fusion protein
MTGRTLPLFRERALVSTRQRWFGPVTVITPPSMRLTASVAGVVIAMLAAAVASIQIPDRVRTYGVLMPVEGLLKVKAARSGRVEHLPVANGDTVEPGEVLLRLSGSQRAPGREPELAARLESLRRELGLLDDAVERQAEMADARERLNRRRLALTGERIATARAEANTRGEQASIAAARADRIGRLAGARAISDDAAEDSVVAVLLSRAVKMAAEQKVLALQDERLRIEQQLVQERDTMAGIQRDAGERREALLRQIAASELQSALEVTAPGGGIVSGLTVRVGEHVAAGDVLMTVYAPESRLEARLFLSPDNAGMISVGQRVELQLKAYPHQLFGTQSAVVTSISNVVLAPDEVDANLLLKGPVFVVRARLRQAAIQVGRRSWSLPPGTSFQADLVRSRWPLYRWLLRSVYGDPARS